MVGLLTAITFVCLLITAATHHHATAIQDQECAVCSVALHKVANTHLVDLPKMVAVLFFYAIFLIEARVIAHVITLYLPPSCGPPRSSPAIC